MSVRVKILKIYCCEDCTALSTTNYCDELERWIEDPTLEPPDDCPLEEI